MSSQTSLPIEEQILELPIDERIRLAKWIWNDLIESNENLPISEEIKAELMARLEEANLNPDEGEPWENVREELERLLNEP